jgi:amino acid transporter
MCNADGSFSLLLTSIFSAGNTYTYCAIRTLYSLALEGRAPTFLTYTTKKGVPIYCFFVVMIFPMLSFMQVSSNSSVVITWFASLVTGGGMFPRPYTPHSSLCMLEERC